MTMAMITGPLIILQSALAPWYLPFVYGGQWLAAGALPVFVLLCLSALVRPIGEAASQLLLSQGMPGANLRINLTFTLILIGSISLAAQWDLPHVAAAVLICHLIGMPLMAWYAWHKTSPNQTVLSPVCTNTTPGGLS